MSRTCFEKGPGGAFSCTTLFRVLVATVRGADDAPTSDYRSRTHGYQGYPTLAGPRPPVRLRIFLVQGEPLAHDDYLKISQHGERSSFTKRRWSRDAGAWSEAAGESSICLKGSG